MSFSGGYSVIYEVLFYALSYFDLHKISLKNTGSFKSAVYIYEN